MQPFTVAGAILQQNPSTTGAATADAHDLLLVCNQRRNGSRDWTPPGGIVDAGETVLEGLAREVEEETQLRITEWGDLLYEVKVEFVHLEWNLSVEVFEAVAWDGDLHVDDPDGVVVDAAFVSGAEVANQLAASPAWVKEPLLGWHSNQVDRGVTMEFRAVKDADNGLVVTRLS